MKNNGLVTLKNAGLVILYAYNLHEQVLVPLQVKRKYELAAFLHIFIQSQVPTEIYCKAFANVEADAMTALVHTSAGFVLCFEVHLEQVGSVLLWNSDSLVFHLNVDPNPVKAISHSKIVH